MLVARLLVAGLFGSVLSLGGITFQSWTFWASLGLFMSYGMLGYVQGMTER